MLLHSNLRLGYTSSNLCGTTGVLAIIRLGFYKTLALLRLETWEKSSVLVQFNPPVIWKG